MITFQIHGGSLCSPVQLSPSVISHAGLHKDLSLNKSFNCAFKCTYSICVPQRPQNVPSRYSIAVGIASGFPLAFSADSCFSYQI